MTQNPTTRYHAEIKITVAGHEARINVFADTLNEIMLDLAKISTQYDELHHQAIREIRNAELKAEQLRKNGILVPKPDKPKPPQAKPVCQSCGTDEAMELIKWTDKKTGEPKQAWKCQACDQWHFPA